MAIGSRPLTPEERRQVAVNALKLLGKIVLVEHTPDHKVYRIWNGSTYCDYDAPNRRFVG